MSFLRTTFFKPYDIKYMFFIQLFVCSETCLYTFFPQNHKISSSLSVNPITQSVSRFGWKLNRCICFFWSSNLSHFQNIPLFQPPSSPLLPSFMEETASLNSDWDSVCGDTNHVMVRVSNEFLAEFFFARIRID